MESFSEKQTFKVLIVGAGAGGMALAILLEQLNIHYHIFELASETKSLGISSPIAFNGNIAPALEQLNIYDDLKKLSKPYNVVEFFDSELNAIGCFDVKEDKVATGYDNLLFSRPNLYALLRKRIPKHKISFNTKVLRTEERDNKVHVYCSDDSVYSGDILVGADGAYSGVRQSLYKHMREKGILPKSDLENFSIGYTVVLGVSNLGNSEKYPQLENQNSTFNQVIYEDNSNCYLITLPDNQISWGFGTQITEETAKLMQSESSEWGPEGINATLEKYRNLRCPLGGTLGDLFDATPRHSISKVFYEEKIFTTWYHGRTVLLGDACHKFHPAGGQGAKAAIQDAIILANCLYSIKEKNFDDIKSAFEDYYQQRYPMAEIGFNESFAMSKILNGQKWSERLIRQAVLNLIPQWVLNAQIRKGAAYRPQIAWLPLVENRGNGPVHPQGFSTKDD